MTRRYTNPRLPLPLPYLTYFIPVVGAAASIVVVLCIFATHFDSPGATTASCQLG